MPQDLALGVSPGIDAILYLPETPERAFPGKVMRTANALAPGTRTLLTKVDIPNPDRIITPGSNGTIELRMPRPTPDRWYRPRPLSSIRGSGGPK